MGLPRRDGRAVVRTGAKPRAVPPVPGAVVVTAGQTSLCLAAKLPESRPKPEGIARAGGSA